MLPNLFNVTSQREKDDQHLRTSEDLGPGGGAQGWKDWPGTLVSQAPPGHLKGVAVHLS